MEDVELDCKKCPAISGAVSGGGRGVDEELDGLMTEAKESYWAGGGLVLGGAICFGFHSTLIKQLMHLGSNPFQVIFYELALASIILGAAHALLRKPLVAFSLRDTARVLFWGIIGVTGTGLTLYAAVQRIPVALAIVLLFYYVPWVFFLEFVVLKIRPSGKRWLALIMILAGSLLATGVIGVAWQELDVWGVLLGLLSGLCYGTFIFGARGLGTVGTPLNRSFLICGGSCVLFVIGGFFSPEAVFAPPDALSRFAVLIVSVTLMGQVIPLLAFSRAIPIIGGSLAAIIASVELPVACVVAFLILGEYLAVSQWLGVALITAAIIVANWRRRELRELPVTPAGGR